MSGKQPTIYSEVQLVVIEFCACKIVHVIKAYGWSGGTHPLFVILHIRCR